MSEPTQYLRKSAIVEAMQFNNDSDAYNVLHWLNANQYKKGEDFASWESDNLIVPTTDGLKTAQAGDWIVQDSHGELYVISPRVFSFLYDSL